MYVVAVRMYSPYSSDHMEIASPGSRRIFSVFSQVLAHIPKVKDNTICMYQNSCLSEAGEALGVSGRCQRFLTVTPENSPAVPL